MSELLSMWNHQVILGIAQAAAAVALCLAVVFLCRRFAVHVERETALSLARGFVQMVAVGMLLAALLHGSLPIAICILVGMTFAAAVTAARRAPGISRPRLLSFCAIAAGGGIAIAVMLATGTLTSDLIVLVPVGSMLIANAMNACAQAMERFERMCWRTLARLKRASRSVPIRQRRLRPMFKAPSTPACCLVLIC